jgi:RNA polymerase sigma-70 factor (ECF subfamily)
MSPEPVPDSVPDDEVLVRIAAGDAAAFTTLFRRRHADVYRVALLMTGVRMAAEDVTQDVFLAVMRDAARYEPGRSTVVAWLCGIARNHARRRLEREGRMVPLPEDSEADRAGVAAHPDPLGDLANARQLDALRRAVLSLPLRYREVVVLCDLQELSYKDAALSLDCAVGTVRSRLHRARALLSAKMRVRPLPGEAAVAKSITRCLA